MSSLVEHQQHATEEMVAKVVVVGDYRAGKTSIVHRLMQSHQHHHAWPPLPATSPTIGVDFFSATVIRSSSSTTHAATRLHMFDTAGLDRYAADVSAIVEGAAVIMCVFDASMKGSLRRMMAHRLAPLCGAAPRTTQNALLVVANKSDLCCPATTSSPFERRKRRMLSQNQRYCMDDGAAFDVLSCSTSSESGGITGDAGLPMRTTTTTTTAAHVDDDAMELLYRTCPRANYVEVSALTGDGMAELEACLLHMVHVYHARHGPCEEVTGTHAPAAMLVVAASPLVIEMSHTNTVDDDESSLEGEKCTSLRAPTTAVAECVADDATQTKKKTKKIHVKREEEVQCVDAESPFEPNDSSFALISFSSFESMRMTDVDAPPLVMRNIESRNKANPTPVERMGMVVGAHVDQQKNDDEANIHRRRAEEVIADVNASWMESLRDAEDAMCFVGWGSPLLRCGNGFGDDHQHVEENTISGMEISVEEWQSGVAVKDVDTCCYTTTKMKNKMKRKMVAPQGRSKSTKYDASNCNCTCCVQ